MAAPKWLAAGAGKVFQTLGQCKGEERRRELVAQLGQSENAEDVFQQSAVTLWSMFLDAHKAKNFPLPEGQVLPVLSLCLTSRLEKLLGGTTAAVDLNEATAQRALDDARNSGNSSKVAEALLALAAARLAAGSVSLPEVGDLVRQALTLVEGDKAQEAMACNIMANVFILMGQGKDAIRSVKQGLLALRSLGGNKIFEVPLLHSLMSASYLRHDPDEALRACQEVALLCKDQKQPLVALAETCTALAHLANDEQGPAEKVLETSLKSLTDADGKILLLGALQEVSFAVGKPVSAVKAANDLLEMEKKRGVKEAVARALLLVSASDPGAPEAQKAAAEAKQHFASLGDKLGEALALVSLAKVQLSQPTTLPTALQSAKQALDAFAQPAGQGFASSLMCLGYLRQEDAKAAERSAREALSLFQDAQHRAGQALAELLVRKSQQLSQKPTECKIVIDDDRVAHLEISGICTPKSMEAVLNALHQARCKEGVKAVVLLLQGSKGPVSPAGYPGTAGGLTAAPDAQAVASGTFLLGLRTLGLPCVVACCGKIAGPAWGLVLASDYRIAAASSSFILPLWGPPECFGDLVGHTVAMQLCYNQGPASALTMLEYGVIHQCQKGEDETKRAAAEVARRIASTPSLACHQSTTMLSPAIEKYASIVARGGLRA